MIERIQTILSGEGLGSVLVRAISGSAGLRLVGMGFGFLVGLQLARGLGAEGYGVYGLAMSIIALLTVPTEFGLPQLLTREVAAAQVRGNWGRVRGIIRWSTRTSLLLTGVVWVGLAVWMALSETMSSPLGPALLAGAALVPAVALLSLNAAALRGTQRIVAGQVSEVALRPAMHSLLIFVAPLFLVPLSPSVAIWLGAAATTVALIVAGVQLRRALPAAALTVPVEKDPREWWASALPMAMTEGMRLLQAHLLIFVLGAMVVLAEVGIFRMAASSVALVMMPLSLFNIASMPVVARLHAAGQHRQLQRMVTLAAAGMVAGVTTLALPFFLAGSPLISFVFGDEFVGGSKALSILCVAGIINAMFGLNAALLNMTGHQRRVTSASAIALFSLVALALPLITQFGIEGAALANLVSVLIWNALMWRDCRRLVSIDTGVWRVIGRASGKNG